MPTVSVIITTHNRPRLLPRAVASAFAAGAGAEVVVVDDASADETARVCRGLDGIRYVRLEENQGVAGARNVGILESSGDYLCFLDDDDVRLEGSLDWQAAALDSAPEAGMVYAQALVDEGDGKGKVYPRRCPEGDIFWELLRRNFIPCGGVLFRRSCLARVGMLDPTAPGVDDWDLWLRIASRYAVLAIERPAAVWRRSTPTSGQVSSRAAETVALSTWLFRRRWVGLARAASASEPERRRARRLFSEHAAGQLVFEAARALGGRQFGQARACLSAALRLHPSGLLRWAAGSALRRVRGRDEASPSSGRRTHATER